MPTIPTYLKRLSQKQLRNQCRASRRQQARKARASRRQIDRIHDQLPKQVRAVFDPVETSFHASDPSPDRPSLPSPDPDFEGTHHRQPAPLSGLVGSWTPQQLSPHLLPRPLVLLDVGTLFCPRRSSPGLYPRAPSNWLATTPSRSTPARTSYGKGCHRDPVRPTHSFTAYRWGHKWSPRTVLVRILFATRRWALPLLMTLYLPEEENRRQGRRHKTPSELMQQMLAV